jgi:hypothetical protein
MTDKLPYFEKMWMVDARRGDGEFFTVAAIRIFPAEGVPLP